MNLKDLYLATGRFNRTKAGSHFINPHCFGEDFAAWLAAELSKFGAQIIRNPYQEDWGWEFSVAFDGSRYFVGIGPESEGPEETDYGHWRIFVERRRAFRELLMDRGKLREDDPLLTLIERIAHEQPDFHDIVRES